MADYQKMYAVLCGAIDQVIDPLSRIPSAARAAGRFAARGAVVCGYHALPDGNAPVQCDCLSRGLSVRRNGKPA